MQTLRSMWILLFFVGVASAQQVGRKPVEPASGPPRQSAEGVLTTSLMAHGGLDLNGVLRVQLTGTSTAGKVIQTVTIAADFSGYTRTDYGAPINRSLVTIPGGAFEIRGEKTTVHPPHAGLYAQFDVFSVLGLRDKYASGADRGLMSNGSIGGHETVRVHAGTNNRKTFYGRPIQDELDVEFDSATGLLAAVHRQDFPDDSLAVSFTSSYAFSDYRDVQGLKLPYRIDRYLNGKLKETITVSDYTINPALPRALFGR